MGKLTKPVMLDSEVVSVLDDIREKYKCSYNEAAKILIKQRPTILDRINDNFDELKRLVPTLYSSLEIMRVIVVRYHKLPEDEKANKNPQIERILTDAMKYIVKEVKE